MQGSVTDTPYRSCDKSAGIGWLPPERLLSSMSATMERLPSRIWLTQFSATSGCTAGSLLELACEQSTAMLTGNRALTSSFSARATDTES